MNDSMLTLLIQQEGSIENYSTKQIKTRGKGNSASYYNYNKYTLK